MVKYLGNRKGRLFLVCGWLGRRVIGGFLRKIGLMPTPFWLIETQPTQIGL